MKPKNIKSKTIIFITIILFLILSVYIIFPKEYRREVAYQGGENLDCICIGRGYSDQSDNFDGGRTYSCTGIVLDCKKSIVTIQNYKENSFEIIASRNQLENVITIPQKQEIIIKSQKDLEKSELKTYYLENSTIIDYISHIDFSSEMVISIYMGTKMTGGYTLNISNIKEYDDKIIVNVNINIASSNCGTTQAITSPFEIIRTKRTEKSIEFNYIENINSCTNIEY